MPAEPSITIFSAIFLLGAFQGILFACLLIFSGKGHRRANFLLALILIFFSLTLTHQFLIDTGYILLLPKLIGFTMPLEAFYGPLLFRYVQVLTQPEQDLTRKQRLRHFILPIACAFLSIPFFQLSLEEKLNMIEQGYSSSSWAGLTSITMPIQMTIFGGLFTVYLIACYLRLYKHNQAITSYFSFREKITLSWLRNLLTLMVVMWILMAIFLAVISSSELTSEVLIVVSLFTVFTILYIGIMGLLQPRIFPVRGSLKGNSDDSLPLSPANTEILPEGDNESLQDAEKYKHSALTPADIDRIATKLSALMVAEKPYLNNNLTLPELAKHVGVTANYLSQVLNDHFQMNFFDFVNSFRIKMASELLLKPNNTTATVLDIAMASAFNSKSAFYSAFKKQTGMTPVQYKKSSTAP